MKAAGVWADVEFSKGAKETRNIDFWHQRNQYNKENPEFPRLIIKNGAYLSHCRNNFCVRRKCVTYLLTLP